MKASASWPGFGALACLAVGFFLLSSPSPPQKITNENGVEIVRNPKEPVPRKDVPSTPVLEEDLVIGSESGDEKYVFSALDSIQVDEDGNIYALDDKDVNLRVFDKTGRYLRAFGKRGQGPGEWQNPRRLFLAPGGQLVVTDSGNERLAFFSKAGGCLSEIPISRRGLSAAIVDRKGRVYGSNLIFGQGEFSISLVRYDAKMNPGTTIAEIRHPIVFPKINPLYERLVFALLSRDRLAWASMKSYEITILDPEAGVTRRILKDYEKRPFTDKDRKETAESMSRAGVSDQVAYVFPDYFSPLYSLIADDGDKLYVRTNEKDKEGRYRYDVFDPDGRCCGKFFLSSEERLAAVRSGKLYCLIKENEAGIPQIKRYSLEWK